MLQCGNIYKCLDYGLLSPELKNAILTVYKPSGNKELSWSYLEKTRVVVSGCSMLHCCSTLDTFLHIDDWPFKRLVPFHCGVNGAKTSIANPNQDDSAPSSPHTLELLQLSRQKHPHDKLTSS